MTIKILDIDQSHLSEANQTTKVAFSLLLRGDEGDQVNIMPVIICKDYFSDLIYAQYNKLKDFTKYGFTWSYSKPLAKEMITTALMDEGPSLSMYISIPKDNKDNVLNQWQLINVVADAMGIGSTLIYEEGPYAPFDIQVNQYKNTCSLYISVPLEWMGNSVNMSLYTLLWRLAAYDLKLKPDMDISTIIDTIYESLKGENTTDQGLITILHKYKSNLLKYINNWRVIGCVPQPLDPDSESIESNIHNGSGIISLLEGMDNLDGAEPAVREWCKTLQGVN